MACDIKTLDEAWNTGIEAFEKSFSVSNDATNALKYAISEINKKHPNADFEINSFTDPIVESMKAEGLLKNDYHFNRESKKKTSKQKLDITKLAEDIFNEKEKTAPEKKVKEDLTDDEKNKISFVSKKYGKRLDKAGLTELLSKEVDGEKISAIIENQMKNEDAVKSQEKQIEVVSKQESFESKIVEKEKTKLKKKVEDIANKFSRLNSQDKETLARKIYDKIEAHGLLREGDVQDIYSSMLNIPSMSNIEKGNFVKEASQAKRNYNDALNKYEAKTKEINNLIEKGQMTPEKEVELAVELDSNYKDLQQKARILDRKKRELSQAISKRRHWEITMLDMAQLNLLSGNTLVSNVLGMTIDTGLRLPKNITSAVTRALLTYKNTGDKKQAVKQLASRTIGVAQRAKEAAYKAKEAALYGAEGGNLGLPNQDHLSAVSAYKKFLQSTGKTKALNLAAFIFRLSPDIVKRGLSSPDAFFTEIIYGAELNRIAESKGLKGIEKKMFLQNPDQKSADIAKKISDDATLKTNVPGASMLNFDAYAKYDAMMKYLPDNMVSRATARSVAFLMAAPVKFIAPFVKTPINLIRIAAMYSIPGLQAGKTIYDYYNTDDAIEKQRIVTEGVAQMAVGFWIQKTAIAVILAGGISAGFKDDDEEVQDAIAEKLGGPNRVNYSAFIRALFGGSPEWQKGDSSVELRALGVLGLVLGTHAHAFNKYDKKTNEEFGSFTSPNVSGEALATLSSAVDNTFLSGANQFIEVLTSDDDNKLNKTKINAFSFLLTGIEPSWVQKISSSKEENVKRTYDKEVDIYENLYRTLGYKFLFDAIDKNKDMKNKVFGVSNANENNLEDNAIKKKDYYLFDNELGRILFAESSVFKSKEIENTPVSKLLDAAKEEEKSERSRLFPSAVGTTQKLGKGYNAITVDLTPDQHEYLMRRASLMRVIMATPYINSEKFKEDSFEEKEESLKKFYLDGLELAKKQLVDKFSGEFIVSEKKDDEIKEEAKANYRYFSNKSLYD